MTHAAVISLFLVLGSVQAAPSVDVVVSHFAEDLKWLLELPQGLQVKVYSKQDKFDQKLNREMEVHALPNVGREAHTYLHHIVKNYDQLADWTVFTQGERPSFGYKGHRLGGGHLIAGDSFANYLTPHPSGQRFVYSGAVHLPSMNHVLRAGFVINDEDMEGGRVEACPKASNWTTWWDMGAFHDFIANKTQEQEGEDSLNFYRKYINPAHAEKEVTMVFPQGGRFAVSRERIQSRAKTVYEQLLKTLSKDIDPYSGYFMEWMWSELFLGHRSHALCHRGPPPSATPWPWMSSPSATLWR